MSGKKDKVKDEDRFSIVQKDFSCCFFCGVKYGLELHEIFFGPANRPKSKEDGEVVALCEADHRGTYGVHNFKPKDLRLKKIGEKYWIDKYAQDCENIDAKLNKFIKRYGKNYLEGVDLNESK